MGTKSFDLSRKNKAMQIISLMLTDNLSKTKACEHIGVEPKYLDRALADFPELGQEMNKIVNARITALFDEIVTERDENLKAILSHLKKMRAELLDEDTSFTRQVKIMDVLAKWTRYLDGVLVKISPKADIVTSPGNNLANTEAVKLLKGANLRQTTTIEVIPKDEDQPTRFIEAETIED